MARPMRHPGLWLVLVMLVGAATAVWPLYVGAVTVVALIIGACYGLRAAAREFSRPPSFRYLHLTRGRGGRA